MNATLSDEDLVRSLRARADLALPEMSLDAAETVVAGRRHRRRRTVAGSTAAVAALALVSGVAVGVIPLPRPAPVATQTPRTLGTDTSVEVAYNTWAANAPVTRTAPDGVWLDLGVSVDVRAPDRPISAIFPVGVAALPDGTAGVTVAARDGFDGGDGSSLGTAATVTWADPRPSRAAFTQRRSGHGSPHRSGPATSTAIRQSSSWEPSRRGSRTRGCS